MSPITIVIADDHKLVRETWALVLSHDARFSVIAECGSAESAITAVKRLNPDIILLDINLPGMNGIEAVPILRKASPVSMIIGISLHTIPGYAKKMMQQGAKGYLTKHSSKQEMIDAILAVYAGEKFLCRQIKEIIADQFTGEDDNRNKLNKLSTRELEIIELLKKGMTSQEVGDILFISRKTVEVHRYNILKKLGLRNTAALISFLNKY